MAGSFCRHSGTLFGLAALALPAALWAQGLTSAAIEGTIRDPTGQPVATAVVEVRNTGSGERWQPRLDRDGRFVLEHVPPGSYQVEARAVGFLAARLEGINLAGGDRFQAVLALVPAPMGLEELRVTTAPIRQPGGSSSGPRSVLTAEQIARVPNVQRNLLNLLVPSPQTFRTDINGWNGALSAIQVDGIQGKDPYSGGYAGAPIFGAPLPVEAIEELATLAPPYDARWGQVTSGVFSIASLRGTNDWTGSAYGVFQNEHLVGSSADATAPFTSWSAGATVMGPVIPDRLHLALVADYTHFGRADRGPFVTDTANGADVDRTGVSLESASRFQQILHNQWDLDAGTLGPSNTRRPRWDVWGKLSLQLGTAGVVDLTQRMGDGKESGTMGPAGNRPSLPAPYLTGSTSRDDLRHVAETRIVWRVQPGNRWSNELVGGWLSFRDRCRPTGDFPRIVTNVDLGGIAAGVDSTCGTTDVQQRSFELSEHATILLGPHLLTGGVHAEWFNVTDGVLVGSQGDWQFDSLEDLAAGRASGYARVLPGPLAPDGPLTRFAVQSFGFYLQDRIALGERLALTVGLRADRPGVPDTGRTNPTVQEALGLTTGATIRAQVLVAPRIGLTWDVAGGGRTVVRAGTGVFTGRPPYRWLSGIYRGSGAEQTLLSCRGSDVPTFDPVNQPTACGGGGRPLGQINVYAPDLRFPQTVQASVGASHLLPAGLTLSADLVYGYGLSTFRYTDANLQSVVRFAAGEAGRPMYGTISPTGTVVTARRAPSLGPVVLVDRGRGDRTFNTSISLSRAMTTWWSAEAGYLWTRSEDRQSVTGFDPLLNFGATPLVGTHADRALAPSLFGATHRIYALASVRLPFRSTFSLLYVGNTGSLYSYVVDGDGNADGIGRSSTGFNDLIYVPRDARPGGDIVLLSPSGTGLADAGAYAALDSLIEREPCLRDRRGQLAARNGCRNGWVSFLNARLVIPVPAPFGHRLELGADVFNVLNLIHSGWGQTRETARGPAVRLLRLVGWDATGDRGFYRLNPPPGPRVNEALSRWRLQFTARYRY